MPAPPSPPRIEAIETRPPSLHRRLPTSPVAMVGIGIILFWVILALLAPLLPLPSPTAQDYLAIANPGPSAKHLLGVDLLGRDTLSRLIWGARIVLALAPISVIVAYLVGSAMGLAGRILPRLHRRPDQPRLRCHPRLPGGRALRRADRRDRRLGRQHRRRRGDDLGAGHRAHRARPGASAWYGRISSPRPGCGARAACSSWRSRSCPTAAGR